MDPFASKKGQEAGDDRHISHGRQHCFCRVGVLGLQDRAEKDRAEKDKRRVTRKFR